MLKLLDSHIFESGAPDSLRHLIVYISRAVKYINHYLQSGDLGYAGSLNKSGEKQLALDVFANKTIMENIMLCRLVSRVVSEEEETEIHCSHDQEHGEYSVAFDPLDGSSLADTNLAIGSIFSIYKGSGFIGRTGRDQVAALYAVYGPRVTIVYTIGKGVHEFTLNDVGEFTLTKENIKLSETASNFAPGNLRAVNAFPTYKKLVESWVADGYTLRYSGGMTPDINHIMLKGQGIFTYPPFPPKYPNGKLRLLFECNPFAFLAEQAGGKAESSQGTVLDIPITEVHQRSSIYIGSKKEVEKVVKALAD